MKYLVSDIGNTTTRICVLNNSFFIEKSLVFYTKNIFEKKFLKKILKRLISKNLNTKILFSSVVPKAFNKIKKAFKNTRFKIFEIKDLRIKEIINIDIKNVSQLGSDRIANAIAGKKYNNCLIIDFGTATTFDIIRNSIYMGGVIAPGVKSSIMNLSRSTALLPKFSLKKQQTTLEK